MAAAASSLAHKTQVATGASSHRTLATDEPFWVRALLITLALAFFGLFLLMPLAAVFAEAFKKGWAAYVAGVPFFQWTVLGTLAYAALRYPQAYAVRLRGTTTLLEDPKKPGVVRKPSAGVTRSLNPNINR